ncbi:hypothetical protein [Actinomadura fibrosa]|uniref:Uncharacterized protein n=1 Tax=Actinomadura fibrosa TaxID=111802 RepID=A0ABW2XC59_9ACTN|nr:hypothetical protein [Actinomadura fibrosa]
MTIIAFLEISGEGTDLFRRDELTRRLRRELAERGVAMEYHSEPPADGAGRGEAITVGTVSVAVTSSPVMSALTEGVFAFLAACPDGAVRISSGAGGIELSDPSSENRLRFSAWLGRDVPPPGEAPP